MYTNYDRYAIYFESAILKLNHEKIKVTWEQAVALTSVHQTEIQNFKHTFNWDWQSHKPNNCYRDIIEEIIQAVEILSLLN